MIILALVGVRFARRQRDTETYFVAKRSVPAWAMGMSLVATIITSVTFIAYPGSGYAGNWSLLVPGAMVVIVLMIVGAVLIPFFRHVVRMSAYEYFERRFGYFARVYSSIAFAAGHFSKMGFVFYLLSLTVSSMSGWNVDRVIMVAGAVTVFYTLIGGIEAVIWADVIQGFVLWTGVLVSIGFLLFLPPGGPAHVLAVAAQNHKFSFGSTDFAFSRPTIIVLSLYGFFFYLQKYSADQTVVQRYLVAKSDRGALRGIALGASLCIPAWTLFMFIGTLLWSFYHITGEKLPSYITKSDQVFPHFLTTHVPVGLAGLFLATLFGAAMSSLSSDLNALSVVAVEDFYRKVRPQCTDPERLKAAKAFVAIFGLLTVIIAIRLAHTKGTALALYYAISAIVAGGLAGLFLLAFLSIRAGRKSAYIGIIASLVFTAWATLTMKGGKMVDLGTWNFPLHEYMIGVIGNIVLLGVGYFAAFVFSEADEKKRSMTVWGWLDQVKMRRDQELQGSASQAEAEG
ncbi:MAG: sodium:solute symporter [Terriglobia bacterium]|nr:sodium:solute symporter [Terriglobia bacterium]